MGICSSCSTGEFINSIEETENILFVVPDDFSDNEIKNLKDAFNIKGLIIRGGEDTLDFIKNIASCNRMGEWRNNYYVTLKENKKFETIKQI
jgi:glutamine amidotransferase PdxT